MRLKKKEGECVYEGLNLKNKYKVKKKTCTIIKRFKMHFLVCAYLYVTLNLVHLLRFSIIFRIFLSIPYDECEMYMPTSSKISIKFPFCRNTGAP